MNERLKIWQDTRDRIAARVRHGSIETHTGVEMLAACDERIREHRDGIVPATEEQDVEAIPAAAALPANVTNLQPMRTARNTATVARMATLRTTALAKYRSDFKRRTGREPTDTATDVLLAGLRTGQSRPIGAPMPLWMLAETIK